MAKQKSRLPTFESGRTPLQNSMLGVLTAFFFMLVASSIATQVFAYRMNFSPYLGDALFSTRSWAFYVPLQWLTWGWSFSDRIGVKPYTDEMLVIALTGCAVSVILGVATTFFAFKRVKGMDSLHGDAHWCSVKEVDATGLMGSKKRQVSGAFVGSVMLDHEGETVHPAHPAYEQRYIPRIIGGEQARDSEGRPLVDVSPEVVRALEYLRDNGPTHILVFAPTRSGKGRGIIVPTLFGWAGSAVVSDQKGENYALTSEMRRRAGQRVGKFAPTCEDGSGWSWNPLDEIRKFTLRDVADAQNIFAMIVDPENKGMEDHFVSRSWELLTGLGLHHIYAEDDASLTGMALFLSDPRFENDLQMWNRMLTAEHDPEGKMGWLDTAGKPTKTHPVVASAAKSMLNTPDDERGSVLSSAKKVLTLFTDPLVAMNTRTSDFLTRDLMTLDSPVSLYYVPTEEDKDRLVPLTRLFFAMVIRRNATQMHAENGRMKANFKHRLLLLIDEFPALRKMEIIQDGLAYVAGYGIKMMLICQDLKQLRDVYGDNETIVAGCHIRISYGPTDETTAKRLEEMVGQTTVGEEEHSVSSNRVGMSGGNVTVSMRKTARPLMTQGEFMSLSMEDMVIFVANNQPIYGRKIKYDEIPEFDAWSRLPAQTKNAPLRQRVARPQRSAATSAQSAPSTPSGTAAAVAQTTPLSAEQQVAVDALLAKDFAIQEIVKVRAF
ncbi:type IV secretory system conjugative DNA transfer family protein [Trinickia mobilis]|uniref:type IV secretory system conjugative DNA transfer family protein n=1 Tax=Trinickia mobilis TaxID=2816356 RepID=UPI001A8D4FC3|nr:type IV secretory system conjugative DNA transfer family protein [Trinickia mobilis]